MKVKNIGIVQPIYKSPEDIREDYALTNRPGSGQHAAKVKDWLVGLPELRVHSPWNRTAIAFSRSAPKHETRRFHVVCLSYAFPNPKR